MRIPKQWTQEVKANDGLTSQTKEALCALHGAAVRHGKCDHKFIGSARRVIDEYATDQVNTETALEEAQGSGYLELRGDIVRLTLP